MELFLDPDYSRQTDRQMNRQTDIQTEGKPIVHFSVNTGRGLIIEEGHESFVKIQPVVKEMQFEVIVDEIVNLILSL